MPKTKIDTNQHTPVLLEAVLDLLKPEPGQSYLDLTAGRGGHAQAVLDETASPKTAVLIDRDQEATDYLQENLGSNGVEVIHQDYLSASQSLVEQKRQFDMILADLGLSSPHLTKSQRGFSFQDEAPLDMRMDQSQTLTAAEVVNRWPEADIAKVLKDFGEEPKARQIAGLIVRHRPLLTTTELAELAKQAWPGYSRVHPATRTFQAIRIAVNGELVQLESALPTWLELLAPGGRLAIISFHSLEDRLVKHFLAEHSGTLDAELELLTKKPIVADQDEIDKNPRARSAKLRAAVKIKTKKKGLGK